MSLRHRNTNTKPELPNVNESRESVDNDQTSVIGSQSQSSNTSIHELKPSHKHPKKKKFLNIAPINIPLNRRLETIGIIWHTISIPVFTLLFLSIVSLGWVSWLVLILPYFIWWYGFDLHTPTNGKAAYRARNWVKNLIVWDWFVNYFPIRVHKSCDFEPTFSNILIEDDEVEDDEEDLVNENSTTLVDKVFQYLGLGKRLNASEKSINKVKRITTGPRYIFGYHPHGVISMGVMGTFATNVIRNEPFEPPAKFLKFLFHDPSKNKPLLPNIGNVFPLTLTTQFTIPFYRDYLLSLGLTSASATNIKSIVNNGDNSVCIVVGGAQESLLNSGVTGNPTVGIGYKKVDEDSRVEPTESKEIKLVLNKRKGFVKLAIELGNINLVPIFGFGEADIYNIIEPKPGSFGDLFQRWLKKTFSFTLPFFSARGVFIYDFGFLPFRNPINVCMGKPIYVPANLLQEYKLKNPDFDVEKEKEQANAPKSKVRRQNSLTNLFNIKPKVAKRPKIPPELLDHYHKMYVDELKRVFDANKDKYGYENVVLKIVE